ncbi:hypothetical protein Rsub_10477 [Raphidocelis subcapitata]|uniref:HTH HARE-type domain-containing protein n=1 Tax=Raphidocelis subcapitata TaxID=307507 RepID=A0A2V0PHC1_9CHLO|nr:hypothetical protein Rsub_10477 [Raphidocelis subcapitata]|eukprot:GBF98412.1 hypothetical protein Rsub_10477 [Raphidocelis subcapitata]
MTKTRRSGGSPGLARDRGEQQKAAAARPPRSTLGPAAAEGVAGGVFKGAAVQILRLERRLMSTGEITKLALQRGFLKAQGKTPEATMASALYTDVKRKPADSLFTRPQEGLFGLREWIHEGFFPEGWCAGGPPILLTGDGPLAPLRAASAPHHRQHCVTKLGPDGEVFVTRSGRGAAAAAAQAGGPQDHEEQRPGMARGRPRAAAGGAQGAGEGGTGGSDDEGPDAGAGAARDASPYGGGRAAAAAGTADAAAADPACPAQRGTPRPPRAHRGQRQPVDPLYVLGLVAEQTGDGGGGSGSGGEAAAEDGAAAAGGNGGGQAREPPPPHRRRRPRALEVGDNDADDCEEDDCDGDTSGAAPVASDAVGAVEAAASGSQPRPASAHPPGGMRALLALALQEAPTSPLPYAASAYVEEDLIRPPTKPAAGPAADPADPQAQPRKRRPLSVAIPGGGAEGDGDPAQLRDDRPPGGGAVAGPGCDASAGEGCAPSRGAGPESLSRLRALAALQAQEGPAAAQHKIPAAAGSLQAHDGSHGQYPHDFAGSGAPQALAAMDWQLLQHHAALVEWGQQQAAAQLQHWQQQCFGLAAGGAGGDAARMVPQFVFSPSSNGGYLDATSYYSSLLPTPTGGWDPAAGAGGGAGGGDLLHQMSVTLGLPPPAPARGPAPRRSSSQIPANPLGPLPLELASPRGQANGGGGRPAKRARCGGAGAGAGGGSAAGAGDAGQAAAAAAAAAAPPPLPSPRSARDLSSLDEWQATIEAAEKALGRDHPAVGRAWIDLARALQAAALHSDRARLATKRAFDVVLAATKSGPAGESFQYLLSRYAGGQRRNNGGGGGQGGCGLSDGGGPDGGAEGDGGGGGGGGGPIGGGAGASYARGSLAAVRRRGGRGARSYAAPGRGSAKLGQLAKGGGGSGGDKVALDVSPAPDAPPAHRPRTSSPLLPPAALQRGGGGGNGGLFGAAAGWLRRARQRQRQWWALAAVAAALLAANAVFVRLSARGPGRPSPSCLALAQSAELPAAFLEAWRPRSRPVPPAEPRLVPSDWSGPVNPAHLAASRAEVVASCGYHVFRYRVAGRRVWSDEDHRADTLLLRYREVFAEMLLTAVWLYRDFPDADLWVSTADEPSACGMAAPVLQFYVLTQDGRGGRTGAGAEGEAGMEFELGELLSGRGGWWEASAAAAAAGGGGGGAPAELPQRTRGFPIVTADTWEDLSLPRESLAAYTACMQARHRSQEPKVIWRGSNTGFNRGWPPEPAAAGPDGAPPAAAAAWPRWRRLLRSKRALAALLARGVDYMDVAFHAFMPEIWDLKPDDPVSRAAQELLVRPPVPLEDWGRYALQLSLDGHAGPFRVPRQYLSGVTATLQQASPFQSWFGPRFKPGEHYFEFKYDLSDLLEAAKNLTTAAAAGDRSVRAAAAAAAEAGAREFSAFSQLDALAWTAARVRELAGPPPPGPPPAADGWRVLKIRRDAGGEGWSSALLRSPGMAAFRRSFVAEMADNLEQG